MTGTDLCVNLATSVPVIFEPPCTCTMLCAMLQSSLCKQSAGLEVITMMLYTLMYTGMLISP